MRILWYIFIINFIINLIYIWKFYFINFFKFYYRKSLFFYTFTRVYFSKIIVLSLKPQYFLIFTSLFTFLSICIVSTHSQILFSSCFNYIILILYVFSCYSFRFFFLIYFRTIYKVARSLLLVVVAAAAVDETMLCCLCCSPLMMHHLSS